MACLIILLNRQIELSERITICISVNNATIIAALLIIKLFAGKM
jgi:hypothetical protein